MDKTILKPLSKREMSQIVGGKWVKINGELYWVPGVAEDTDENSAYLVVNECDN